MNMTQKVIQSNDIRSLQTIIDTMPVASYIIGSQGIIVDCNKFALSLFDGTKKEDLIGKNAEIFLPRIQKNGHDSGMESRKKIEQVHLEKTLTFSFDLQTLTGRTFSAKISLSEILFEEEQCLMYTIVDTSDQISHGDEIEAFIRENPHAIMTLSPELAVMDVNPAFCKISGYTREQAIHMQHHEFKSTNREGATAGDAILNKKAMGGKIICLFPGGIRHLEYTYLPIFDTYGNVIKIFDIFADVTPLTDKINESNSLIQENPASIISLEPSGKILSVNPSFMALSHLSEEKLLSMHLQEFKILQRDGLPLDKILTEKQTSKGRLVVDFGWAIKTLDFTYIPVMDANKNVTALVAMYIDISDQVARLEEIEAFIHENPHAIMILTSEMKVMDVNPAFCKISGYTHEQAIHMQHHEFKSTNREGATAADAIKNKRAMGGKITCLFPGGIRHLEYTYLPIFDKGGNVTKIFDIFADVTPLVEKISESETLIRENPASIVSLDTKGKILSVNSAFITLTHRPEEELLKMGMHDFNNLEREGMSATEAVASKKPSKGRMVVDFGWAVRILDYTYIPVMDANNEVTGLVAMYDDISDRVASEEENKALIRDNPHAILTMNPDLRIKDINPAFYQITGYSRSETANIKLSDFKVTEREGQTTDDAARAKKSVKGRIKVNFPSGMRDLDYVYIPILDKKGNVVKFMEIFSDMTSIRSLVRYLEQSVMAVQNDLSSLAKGDTKFTATILDSDEHSASAREQFVKIGEAINAARQAIAQLVGDSNAIANAAIAGDLKYRSDSSVHEGDFRTIIEGMNHTLDSIGGPINESLRISNEYANYNFISRFNEKIEAKGDWIPFKEALNNIGLQVCDAISLINKNISDLAASAEEANASIEEVLAGAQQITQNTSMVSQNASQGEEGIQQVLKAMDDLNVTVGAVSRKAESVSVASTETNTFAKEGISLAKKSDTAMGDITDSTSKVGSIVNDINSQMDEIGKIVRLISDIANQTNLLALNAAIEAARAGEAGRGFAVVAAEVKSLAQDSRKSAENIADMISALQNKANQATEAMGKSTTAVEDGSAALEQTLAAFTRIAETIEDINRNIVEVASASEEQAASVEEVTASIQEVSNLIQNTSHEAGDAAAATEESNASIDEIGRIMSGVVGVVESVTKEMSKFKVV